MKKKLILAIALLGIIFVTGCAQKIPRNEPIWVQEFIQKAMDDPVANPGVQVFKCEYQGETAYYMPGQCCDQFGVLYSENGTGICAPDGGITGQGDGRCADSARFCELVWQDPRSHAFDKMGKFDNI